MMAVRRRARDFAEIFRDATRIEYSVRNAVLRLSGNGRKRPALPPPLILSPLSSSALVCVYRERECGPKREMHIALASLGRCNRNRADFLDQVPSPFARCAYPSSDS